MGERTLEIVHEYFAFQKGQPLNVPIEGGVWKGDAK